MTERMSPMQRSTWLHRADLVRATCALLSSKQKSAAIKPNHRAFQAALTTKIVATGVTKDSGQTPEAPAAPILNTLSP